MPQLSVGRLGHLLVGVHVSIQVAANDSGILLAPQLPRSGIGSESLSHLPVESVTSIKIVWRHAKNSPLWCNDEVDTISKASKKWPFEDRHQE